MARLGAVEVRAPPGGPQPAARLRRRLSGGVLRRDRRQRRRSGRPPAAIHSLRALEGDHGRAGPACVRAPAAELRGARPCRGRERRDRRPRRPAALLPPRAARRRRSRACPGVVREGRISVARAGPEPSRRDPRRRAADRAQRDPLHDVRVAVPQARRRAGRPAADRRRGTRLRDRQAARPRGSPSACPDLRARPPAAGPARRVPGAARATRLRDRGGVPRYLVSRHPVGRSAHPPLAAVPRPGRRGRASALVRGDHGARGLTGRACVGSLPSVVALSRASSDPEVPPAAFYCVADESYFLGAVGLINSLRLAGHDEPIFLLACGLETARRELLEPHVTLVDPPRDAPPWLLKTVAPRLHPAETMVLVDTDMIVTRSLAPLVELAAGGRAVAFENNIDRFVPEWGALLDLGPVRRQPYVSSALVAIGRRLSPGTPFEGLEVTDAEAVRCAYEDGTEPYVVHHSLWPKPWQAPAYEGVYTRLLRRLLTGADVAIKVAREDVPLGLRNGAVAFAERQRVKAREQVRWRLGGLLGERLGVGPLRRGRVT